MVTARDDEIDSIMEMLAHVPVDITVIRLSSDEYEKRIEVIPIKETNCGIWMGFSTYETYGLCFGHGLCFEDIPIAEFRPVDVAEAILKGRVSERIWLRGNKLIKSEGKIILEDGRALTDTAYLSWWPLGRLRVQDIFYEPYI